MNTDTSKALKQQRLIILLIVLSSIEVNAKININLSPTIIHYESSSPDTLKISFCDANVALYWDEGTRQPLTIYDTKDVDIVLVKNKKGAYSQQVLIYGEATELKLHGKSGTNIKILQWGETRIKHLMFDTKNSLQCIPAHLPLECDNMESAFSNCGFINRKPSCHLVDSIECWDVSNIKNMKKMFFKTEIYADLNQWDVSNTENMDSMFCESVILISMHNWNVSNVRSMKAMFAYCESSISPNLENWDIRNVTNMDHMFLNSEFTPDISMRHANKNLSMVSIFQGCKGYNNDFVKWLAKKAR